MSVSETKIISICAVCGLSAAALCLYIYNNKQKSDEIENSSVTRERKLSRGIGKKNRNSQADLLSLDTEESLFNVEHSRGITKDLPQNQSKKSEAKVVVVIVGLPGKIFFSSEGAR